MTNRELSIYINQSQRETKRIFDPVRDAFYELNLGPITKQIAEIYLNGSIPPNYNQYLKALDARKLIAEQGGFRMFIAERAIKGGFFDPWVMLHSAAKYYLEEQLSEDFHDLIIKPIDDLLEREATEKEEHILAKEKAHKAIGSMMVTIKETYAELEKIPSYLLAGTKEDMIKNNLMSLLEETASMK